MISITEHRHAVERAARTRRQHDRAQIALSQAHEAHRIAAEDADAAESELRSIYERAINEERRRLEGSDGAMTTGERRHDE